MPVDCNRVNANCDSPLRIDRIPVNILIPVGTARPEAEYIGNAHLARLNVSFEVRCGEDFYGEDCLTFCSNFDSCDGCGLTGFTGEFCQFGVANCRQRYCNGNGDCLEGEPPACDCDTGFAGDFCQENIDDCINTGCRNGECIDGVDSFTCDCEVGFTGNMCDTNITYYADVNCNDNGQCEDEVDGFTCLCDPGFTGDLCQEESESCSRIFETCMYIGITCPCSSHCPEAIKSGHPYCGQLTDSRGYTNLLSSYVVKEASWCSVPHNYPPPPPGG